MIVVAETAIPLCKNEYKFTRALCRLNILVYAHVQIRPFRLIGDRRKKTLFYQIFQFATFFFDSRNILFMDPLKCLGSPIQIM